MFKRFFILLVALFLSAGAVSAREKDIGLPAAGTVPGDFFYFLETISEGIGSLFTFGDIAKAERAVTLAEERLAEAEVLADRGDAKRAEKMAEKYQEQMEKALKKAEKAREDGEATDDVLATIAEATARYQTVLLGVYEKVPEEARSGIENAIQQSTKEHERALGAISEEKQGEMQDELDALSQEMDMMLTDMEARGVSVPEMRGGDDGDLGDDTNEDVSSDRKKKDKGTEDLESEMNKLDKDINGELLNDTDGARGI